MSRYISVKSHLQGDRPKIMERLHSDWSFVQQIAKGNTQYVDIPCPLSRFRQGRRSEHKDTQRSPQNKSRGYNEMFKFPPERCVGIAHAVELSRLISISLSRG